jgi:hypothetical protein
MAAAVPTMAAAVATMAIAAVPTMAIAAVPTVMAAAVPTMAAAVVGVIIEVCVVSVHGLNHASGPPPARHRCGRSNGDPNRRSGRNTSSSTGCARSNI